MPSPTRPLSAAALWLALCLLAGICTRHHVWSRAVEAGVPDGAEVHGLSTLDGFYYERLVRDPPPPDGRDRLRVHPEGRPYPSPAPLLVALGRLLHAAGLDLTTLVRWLPAVLGSLIALPAFLLGLRLGGPWAAATASLVAALHPALVERTGMGRFDTDGLIQLLFCGTVAATLALTDAWRQGRSTTAPVAGLIAMLVGLLWTWDQAPDAAVLLAGLVAAAALPRLATAWRGIPRRGRIEAGLLALAFAGGLAYAGAKSESGWLNRLRGRWEYLRQAEPAGVDVGETISEQADLSLTDWLHTQGGPVVGLLAVAGIVANRRRLGLDTLILLAPLLPGLLGGMMAGRFTLFALPTIAAGAGLLVPWAANRFPPGFRRTAAASALLIVTVLPLLNPRVGWRAAGYASTRVLAEPDPSTGWPGIAGRTLPIVAWWDAGYALQNRLGAATWTDGGHHPRAALLPLAKALALPVGQAPALPVLATASPAHLCIEPHTLRAFPWMIRMATGQDPPVFQPFFGVTASDNGELTGSDGLRVRLQPWSPEARDRIVVSPMPSLTVEGKTFAHPDLVLVANLPQRVAALMDQRLLETPLVQLYYLDDADPAHFSLAVRRGASGLWLAR